MFTYLPTACISNFNPRPDPPPPPPPPPTCGTLPASRKGVVNGCFSGDSSVCAGCLAGFIVAGHTMTDLGWPGVSRLAGHALTSRLQLAMQDWACLVSNSRRWFTTSFLPESDARSVSASCLTRQLVAGLVVTHELASAGYGQRFSPAFGKEFLLWCDH